MVLLAVPPDNTISASPGGIRRAMVRGKRPARPNASDDVLNYECTRFHLVHNHNSCLSPIPTFSASLVDREHRGADIIAIKIPKHLQLLNRNFATSS